MYPVAEFEKVRPGVSGRLERDVDDAVVTRHVGGRGIFATPAMVQLMEQCSHKSVEPLLPEGFTTVGFEVCVRHLAPTEPGGHVTVTSRLTKVDAHKLWFDVECREGEKLCGSGTHRRMIVPSWPR
jgi:predicted thioesterase